MLHAVQGTLAIDQCIAFKANNKAPEVFCYILQNGHFTEAIAFYNYSGENSPSKVLCAVNMYKQVATLCNLLVVYIRKLA